MLTPIPDTLRYLTKDPLAWRATTRYELCTSMQQLDDYLTPALSSKEVVGADWETNTLNLFKRTWFPTDPEVLARVQRQYKQLRAVGLVFSVSEGTAMYCPVGHITGYEWNLRAADVVDRLRQLDRAEVPTVWWNYRYDGEVNRILFDLVLCHWRDAMIAAHLEDANRKTYKLKDSAERMLGFRMIKFAEVLGRATGDDEEEQHTFEYVDPVDAVPYAGGDADLTRRIWLLPSVQDALRKQATVYRIEEALLPNMDRTVRNGVYMDLGYLRELQTVVGGEVVKEVGSKKTVVRPASGMIAELQSKVFAALGGSFNIDSPKQLAERLKAAGVVMTVKTSTGKDSTAKLVLQQLAETHPYAALVVQYRELATQSRNYIDKLIDACEYFGPLLRFAYNQIGAPTGRMSGGGEGDEDLSYEKGYVPLNEQSTPDPKKKKYLPNIRSAFVANDPTTDSDEWVHVCADYSQIELRVLACISREPAWIDAFRRGVDIHLATARSTYKEPAMPTSDPRRQKGKTLNFAVVFGAEEDTIARQAGVEKSEARTMLKNFFRGLRALSSYIEATHARGAREKFVETWAGRRRPLDEYFYPGAKKSVVSRGERETVSHQVQGGAAEIFKIAATRIQRMIDRQGWQDDAFVTMYMHDEFDFRVRRAILREFLTELKTAMTFQVKDWPVTFTTDQEVGWDWGVLYPAEDKVDEKTGQTIQGWLSMEESGTLPPRRGRQTVTPLAECRDHYEASRASTKTGEFTGVD